MGQNAHARRALCYALLVPERSLAKLLETRRVILCVGCGGVGKTTTTAALGLAAAKRGMRVLCLTIDPARRRAQNLGRSGEKNEATSVDHALLERVGVPAGGALTVMRVDTKETFDALVRQLAPTPERRDRILSNVLYKYISTSLAGTQEYMAMEKLYALRDDPSYDIVLLDTPPTTHALDFLDAPERLVSAIDSPAIKWFLQAFESDRKLSFNLLARSTATLLRGLGKLTGGGFLEQVAAFISEMNAVFVGWKARAEMVSAALRGPTVGYVLVTTPDPLALREVRFFADRLRKEQIAPDACVVNRVSPELASTEDPAAALARAGLPADAAFAAKCQEAASDAQRMAKLDRLHLLAIELLLEETTHVTVPTFARDVYDLAALSEVAAVLAPAAPAASPA